jgi:hypothetical protein
MLMDQLLETIQAERDRQIREADRVRLVRDPRTDEVDTPPVRNDRLSAVEGRAVGRQPRPATESPR